MGKRLAACLDGAVVMKEVEVVVHYQVLKGRPQVAADRSLKMCSMEGPCFRSPVK